MYVIHARTFPGVEGFSFIWHPNAIDKRLDDADTVSLRFDSLRNVSQQESLRLIERALNESNIHWLRRSGSMWEFDLTTFAQEQNPPDFPEWAKGTMLIEPDINQTQESVHAPTGAPPPADWSFLQHTVVVFNVRREDVMSKCQRIFLSHKGVDKPAFVRPFFKTLHLLGFDPWLDERAMPAGTELHRGIQQGFKDSCAAVFFITPNFKDTAYLATEVDYAVTEKMEKKDRFAIVALVFKDKAGRQGVVPELLTRYVFKHPRNRLEALRDILEAIPLVVGPPRWR